MSGQRGVEEPPRAVGTQVAGWALLVVGFVGAFVHLGDDGAVRGARGVAGVVALLLGGLLLARVTWARWTRTQLPPLRGTAGRSGRRAPALQLPPPDRRLRARTVLAAVAVLAVEVLVVVLAAVRRSPPLLAVALALAPLAATGGAGLLAMRRR